MEKAISNLTSEEVYNYLNSLRINDLNNISKYVFVKYVLYNRANKKLKFRGLLEELQQLIYKYKW